MKIRLERFIDDESMAHAEDSRAFFEAKQAAGGQQGPTNHDQLQQARSMVPAGPSDSRAIVISVEYRLAPEHPWPAAPDDCETAALWLLDEGREVLGEKPVLIGGASAGATLALTTLLRLRDRGVVQPVVGAVLQFGAYDLSGQTPGGRLYADEWFIQAYAGQAEDRTLPDISPLYGDLRGLPPTLLLVGARDVLLEDNLAMAARLSAAGNDVDLRVFPEAMHGFTGHPTSMAAAALAGVETWISSRLGERQPSAVSPTSR